MNKRGLGGIFCLISAIIFVAYKLTAAIFISNATTWDGQIYASALEYTKGNMPTLAVIALVVGVIFILWEEWEEWKQTHH